MNKAQTSIIIDIAVLAIVFIICLTALTNLNLIFDAIGFFAFGIVVVSIMGIAVTAIMIYLTVQGLNDLRSGP